MSLIKNKATINEDLDPSLVIRRLKAEVLTLREEIGFLKVQTYAHMCTLFICMYVRTYAYMMHVFVHACMSVCKCTYVRKYVRAACVRTSVLLCMCVFLQQLFLYCTLFINNNIILTLI